jgi:hypothetical protein
MVASLLETAAFTCTCRAEHTNINTCWAPHCGSWLSSAARRGPATPGTAPATGTCRGTCRAEITNFNTHSNFGKFNPAPATEACTGTHTWHPMPTVMTEEVRLLQFVLCGCGGWQSPAAGRSPTTRGATAVTVVVTTAVHLPQEPAPAQACGVSHCSRMRQPVLCATASNVGYTCIAAGQYNNRPSH